MVDFHKRLAQALALRGMTQKELARQLETSQPSLSRIINGKQHIDFHLIVKTCEILQVSLDWLAYGREDRSAASPFYSDPQRQRIEYLISVIDNSRYPALIRLLQDFAEARKKETKVLHAKDQVAETGGFPES